MSCGHAVLPGSLAFYVFSEISKGKYEIHCPYIDPSNPLNKCGKKWTYREIRKMALLTESERAYVELQLSKNRLNKIDSFVNCPKCSSYIITRGSKNNRVKCRNCLKLRQANDFCALCLKKWHGSGDQYCGNYDCQIDFRIEILKNASLIKVKGYTVPSIRACPKCGILVEMESFPNYCKTVNCLCGFKFCFICLGYCTQSSKIFPCFDANSSALDKQTSLKIECKPKSIQTEVPPISIQTPIKSHI